MQELVPGARETIEALRRLGKPVYVVSGGLLPSVGYLAQALAIPMSHVYAVPIEFDANGGYRGFDQGSPLPRADGKAVVCRELAERHGAIAMVGDGMTDVAARAGGAYVIGFGGVAYRETVATGADCYVAHAELTATLETLLSEEERKALALGDRGGSATVIGPWPKVNSTFGVLTLEWRTYSSSAARGADLRHRVAC